MFDEADEMLKADGFADDSVRLIKEIRKRNPKVRNLHGYWVFGQCLVIGLVWATYV